MKTGINKIFLSAFCLVMLLLASSNAEAAVFSDIADKTTQFAKGLRTLAYVISGFGIIMFTFMAIFGKISFRHLGYIVISLFFLSGMGALIDYTTNQKGLYYGKFNDTYIKAGTSTGKFSTGRNSSL